MESTFIIENQREVRVTSQNNRTMNLIRLAGMTFCLLLGNAMMLCGQSTLTNGYLMYNVSVDSDQPAAAMLSAMGSTIELAFKEKKTKMVAKIAGATNTVHLIADHAAVKGLSLLDVLGEKKAVRHGSDDYAEVERAIQLLAANPMRITDQTKNIAGYVCQKILMKDKQSGANIILYVTDRIQPKDPLARQLYKTIKGFPLGIVVRKDDTTVRATATKIMGTTPSDGAFALSIPSGYEVTSIRELERKAEQKIQQH